jgi:SAM-dependent methyltransferase
MSDPPTFVTQRPLDIHADSWRNPYRLAAVRLRAVISDLGDFAALPSGSVVLDYGCATTPYRDLVGAGSTYVGADIAGNTAAEVELKGDGTVPMADASVDVVLSTQVLEHVRDPQLYLAETLRLLKPGGYVVLTTHGIMHFHEDPVDYWRWTSEGLSKLLRDTGFEIVEMRGIMGLASAAIQLFQIATTDHVPGFARRPYVAAMQWAATFIDRRYSEPARLRDSLVLAVRAQRPA